MSLAGVVAVAKSFPGGVQKESTGLDLVWRRANEEWGEEGGCKRFCRSSQCISVGTVIAL